MTFSISAILIVAFIALFCGLALGAYIGVEASYKWKYCRDLLPPNKGRNIVNYPVAFFDDEFGVIVDQAEYHPNRADKWLTVPNGEPCAPFAWFDLPFPPYPDKPQDIGKSGGVDTYI